MGVGCFVIQSLPTTAGEGQGLGVCIKCFLYVSSCIFWALKSLSHLHSFLLQENIGGYPKLVPNACSSRCLHAWFSPSANLMLIVEAGDGSPITTTYRLAVLSLFLSSFLWLCIMTALDPYPSVINNHWILQHGNFTPAFFVIVISWFLFLFCCFTKTLRFNFDLF